MSLELRIEKIVPRGLGLARQDGRVYLVAGALPEELVEAEAINKTEAKLLRVLEASPNRVAPPNNAPPTLDLAHANYAAQLKYKQSFVQETLARIGKIEFDVAATQPSPKQWNYRNGAQYLITTNGLAYRERGTHQAQTLRQDPLVGENINQLIANLNAQPMLNAHEIVLRQSFSTHQILACIVGEERNTSKHTHAELKDLGVVGLSAAEASEDGRFRGGVRQLWGETNILETYGQHALSINATAFAQVNPSATSNLYKRAAELVSELKSETEKNRALDLYGGAGGLAFHIAKYFTRTTILEISPEAVRRGTRDAKRLGFTNLEFVRGDASQADELPKPNFISLDPPRNGLNKETLQTLLNIKPKNILYVSCDPATWARDVGELSRNGYALRVVEPWDFYPQTSHVEVLSLLELV